MNSLYSYNDWRDYALAHERKSPWTDEKGNNTPEYNHKYYEAHREEIIKRVQENRRNGFSDPDAEQNGYDWAHKDGSGKAYANEDARRKEYLRLANEDAFSKAEGEYEDWAVAEESLKNNKDYPPEVLENIRKNNAAARENIIKLQETVQNYVKAHQGELTNDQIAKLYTDLDQQTALERKRIIDIGTGEGKKYVDDLLKTGQKSTTKSETKTSKSSKDSKKPASSNNKPAKDDSPKKDEKDKDDKKPEKNVIDKLVDKYGGLTPEERREKYGKGARHSAMYGDNDWRSYLEHKAKKGESKYDWSTGTNPPDYNHDYWEKNKEKILAQRAKADGKSTDEVEKKHIRRFKGENGAEGIGYKVKTDDGKSYENTDDWSADLTDDEKKNIDAHNAQVDKNIEDLKKSVEDYIEKNKDKLSEDDIKKLRDDLATQIDIANEQRISTKNSDDRDYIMELRKKASESSEEKKSEPEASKPAKANPTSTKPATSNTKPNGGTTKPKEGLTKSGTTVTNAKGEKQEFYYQKSPEAPKVESARDKQDREQAAKNKTYNTAADLKRADYEAMGKAPSDSTTPYEKAKKEEEEKEKDRLKQSAFTAYNDWRNYLAHRMY